MNSAAELAFMVRRCFQRLRAAADALHEDLGINASMRAILEDVTLNGQRTVPQIAAAKDVSRQHVQHIVDALIDRGLAALADNPGHRRSPFVALTAKGRKTFAEVAKREKRAFGKLAAAMNPSDTKAGISALRNLFVALEPLTKGEKHDDADDRDRAL